MVEIFLIGPHQLGIRIIYISGDPEDRANKSYRVWFKVVPPGGEPVTDPEKLTGAFSTQRKKDLINFDYTDSGSTAYIAVQIENGEKKGPWGPIVSAVIP
jgi:predicted PolB exonuclease-like 3'-5' exonuclease